MKAYRIPKGLLAAIGGCSQTTPLNQHRPGKPIYLDIQAYSDLMEVAFIGPNGERLWTLRFTESDK